MLFYCCIVLSKMPNQSLFECGLGVILVTKAWMLRTKMQSDNHITGLKRLLKVKLLCDKTKRDKEVLCISLKEEDGLKESASREIMDE